MLRSGACGLKCGLSGLLPSGDGGARVIGQRPETRASQWLEFQTLRHHWMIVKRVRLPRTHHRALLSPSHFHGPPSSGWPAQVSALAADQLPTSRTLKQLPILDT